MAEALIVRRGGAGDKGPGNINFGNGNKAGYTFTTTLIQSNTNFIVPNDAYQNQFSVRAFGGGGGGAYFNSSANIYRFSPAHGGGGGWMNNGEFVLTPGTSIRCYIGNGGTRGNQRNIATSGGTTTFGTYLSANGGSAGDRLLSSGSGGGGWVYIDYRTEYGQGIYGNIKCSEGGEGSQFGGGGPGGGGGAWGGGGSGIHIAYGSDAYNGYFEDIFVNNHGIGGGLGGNGGLITKGTINIRRGNNGTNTITYVNNVPNSELRGPGLGSNGSLPLVDYNSASYASGAGGGFGGNGGSCNVEPVVVYQRYSIAYDYDQYWECSISAGLIAGAGGGGYGSNGGSLISGSQNCIVGGGGGGYGGNGGNGKNYCGGGGGGYGDGGEYGVSPGLAGGGAGNQNGGKGCIIVEWYKKNA